MSDAPPPALSPIRAALHTQLRALLRENPGFGCDALLIAADWLSQDAVDLEIGGQRIAAEAAAWFAGELRTVAAEARALAPLFAPPQEHAAP